MSHTGRVWLLCLTISSHYIGIRTDGVLSGLLGNLFPNNTVVNNNTLIANPYATQIKLIETIAMCSYSEKQLTFINETLSADEDPVKSQYTTFENANGKVTAWVAVQQVSGQWGYSYLEVEIKSGSVQQYTSNRQAAIDRVKTNQVVDLNQVYNYACADIDILCPNRETETPWRYFEGKCFALPVLNMENGESTCEESDSSLLTVKYDSGEGGRLYYFLAGWYNELYPSTLIKTKDATIYSCSYNQSGIVLMELKIE